MIGMILGNRYELLEKIGEGGMAHVYKARCNKLKRYVAVKILKQEFSNNEEISEKFKREATAIAALSDPNIVNVLDVGTQDEINYIVMEYVCGKTLKDIIEFNGKLTYATAVKLALQISKALECAHKNNIIHRDVKPQNILVSENGDIKVADFGIAKSTDSATITNTTSIMGSAHYISPEQAKGIYIDSRADIYSFGIVLYEMVTGKLPFQGESPVTVALKHLQETPVAPKSINAGVPESLNRLILKCMEKEPIRRYQSFNEILRDLQKIQQDPDVVIGELLDNDSQNTIVMSSMDLGRGNTGVIDSINLKDYEEDYEEDDDWDEEEDDDDSILPFRKKSKVKDVNKTKANNKIGKIIIGIIILLMLGGTGYFFAMKSRPKEVKIPDIINMTADEAKTKLEELGLKLEEVGFEKSDKPENTIIKVNPLVGSTVKEGSVVNVTISSGEEKFIMPNFRDYEVTNIRKYLDSQQFSNYSIVEQYSDKVPKGYYISQNPEPKTEISKDTKIEIIVSKGPEIKLVLVPPVINKSKSEAEEILKQLKLTVNILDETTENKDEDGKVLKQSPSGTNVQEGTEITITVGKYEEKLIQIPDVIGKPEGEAQKTLEDLGFSVVVKEVVTDNKDKNGKVIEQSSTGKVKKGTTVTITIGKFEDKKPNPPGNEGAEDDQESDDGQTTNGNSLDSIHTNISNNNN